MARGRDREGVIRRSRPRLLKLSNLGLKIFGQDFDLESSTRRHLRWGGGSLRAFRRAITEGLGVKERSVKRLKLRERETFPKPFQNRIQTPPNQRKLQVQPRKQEKFLKRLPSMFGKLLGHILEAQSLPREAQEAPKTSKMEPKT